MSQFVRPTILLLKEGTDQSQGKGQIIHNINACQAVVDILATTLGPRGMDKLIQQGSQTTISNDGATIIKCLDIVHPAAKMLTDISLAQDYEVGDGTTTVVLLAGELLKAAKPFIEEGVHPQIIVKGYRRACKVATDKLKHLAVDMSKTKDEEYVVMLERCGATALNSKLISGKKGFFSKMAVEAVLSLDDDMTLDHIGIKKVPGGSMEESFLVKGVAFKKTFSYAGFEQQPKKLINPQIALLNIELEVKAERANAEIRIDNVAEYQKVVDAEWTLLTDKLDKIVQSGAKVVLSCLPIGDVATQYFADRNIFCAGRVAKDDMVRVKLGCGGEVLTSVSNIVKSTDLGMCGLFEEQQVGAERYNFFRDCPDAHTCTIVLRGGAEQFIEESARSLHDAIMIVKRCIQKRSVVGGGGAIEMELSRYLKHYAKSIGDKTQLIVSAFARAFECIPRCLAINAGLDSLNIVTELRYRHAQGMRWAGVDIDKEDVQDTMANFVWEPAANKLNAILAATEAACLILSVDETVKNPKSKNAADDRPAPVPGMRPDGPVSIR